MILLIIDVSTFTYDKECFNNIPAIHQRYNDLRKLSLSSFLFKISILLALFWWIALKQLSTHMTLLVNIHVFIPMYVHRIIRKPRKS